MIPKRVEFLQFSVNITVLGNMLTTIKVTDYLTVFATELPERAVGEAGLRDPAAAVGQCTGGAEPTAGLHRLQQLRLIPAASHTTHLAHPLESLCVLQPHQGSRPHH